MVGEGKVKRAKTSWCEKSSLDQNGNAEPHKFQCISVITRNPQTLIKSSSQLDDDDVVIVAEYDGRTDAADVAELSKDSSGGDAKRENPRRNSVKRRRSGDGDGELPDNQFWYVDCGPEVVEFDSSDSESGTEYEASGEESEYRDPSCSENESDTDHEMSINSDCEKTVASAEPSRPRFAVLEETSYFVPGQRTWKREMGVRIRGPNPGEEAAKWCEEAFKDLFVHLTSSCDATDYVGFTFAITESTHAPVSLSCRSIGDYTYEDLFNLVGSAGNPAAAFKMDDTFLITTRVVHGASSRELADPDGPTIVGKSVLTIREDDMLSLPRALVAACVHAARGDARAGELHALWGRIRDRTGSLQLTRALELAKNAGVEAPKTSYGIADVEKFQRYLAADGFAVIVYDIASLGRGGGALYNGTSALKSVRGGAACRTIYLAYYERQRHYQPILKPAAAAGGRGFCAPCNARYVDESDHACAHRCPQCFGSPPCRAEARENLNCTACRRSFRGAGCYARHKAARPRRGAAGDAVCRTIRRCDECGEIVRTGDGRRRHRCGEANYRTRSWSENAGKS